MYLYLQSSCVCVWDEKTVGGDVHWVAVGSQFCCSVLFYPFRFMSFLSVFCVCARSSQTAAAYWLEHFQPCGSCWCFVHCHSVFISVTVSLRVNASYSPLVCMFVCSVMSVFAELNCFLWPLAYLFYLWKGGGGSPVLLLYSVGSFWFAVGLFHVGMVCSCLLHWQGGGEVGCPVLFHSLCICGVSSSLLSTNVYLLTSLLEWEGRGLSCAVSLTRCLWCVLTLLEWEGRGLSCAVSLTQSLWCVLTLLEWEGRGLSCAVSLTRCLWCVLTLLEWEGRGLSCAVSLTQCLWCVLTLLEWEGGGGLSCAVLLTRCFWCVLTLSEWEGRGLSCAVLLTGCLWCVLTLLEWWICRGGGGGGCWNGVFVGGGGGMHPGLFYPPLGVCDVASSMLEWCVFVLGGGTRCSRCSSLLMCVCVGGVGGGGGALSCAVSVTGCFSLWCGLQSVRILCLSTWGGGGSLFVVYLGWGWVGLSPVVLLFQCLWCMCSPVCVCWNGVFLPTLAEEVASLQGSTQGHEPQTPCPAEAQAGSGPLGNTFLPFVYTYSRVGPAVCPLERLRAHACGVDLHWPHQEREKNQYQVTMLWAIEQPTELHKTKREKDIWSQIQFSVWGLG